MNDVSPFEPSLVGAVWRDRVLVACVLAASLAIAIAYTVTRPAQYKATAQLIVEDPRTGTQGAAPQERYVADQAAVLGSLNVATEAAKVDASRKSPLGLSARTYLEDTSISLAAQDSNQISVAFSAATEGTAVAGVDNVVTAYRNVLRANAERRVAGQLARVESRLVEVEQELTQIETQLQGGAPPPGRPVQTLSALQTQELQLLDQRNRLFGDRDDFNFEIEQAQRAIFNYSPATAAERAWLLGAIRNIILALVLGGIAACSVAYLRATRRPVFSSPGEPELILNVPLLAEVPAWSHRSRQSLPVVEHPSSPSARAFRFAAASVDIQRAATGARCFTVTSAGESDGRSTATANIGLALAADGHRVLLIDTDLESQGLSRVLRGDRRSGPGWMDVVAGRARVDDVLLPAIDSDVSVSALLPAGDRPVSAAQFFGADRSREQLQMLFEELKDRFDVILIDGPPLLPVAYAATVTSCADAALVIVNDGSPVPEQEELARRLRLIGRSPVGYIYNHAPRGRRTAAVPVSLRPAPEAAPVASDPASPPRRAEHLPMRPRPLAGRAWHCQCGRDNPSAFDNCPRCGQTQHARPQSAGG
jgi:Mrp family chromosome partitioning ATPase